MSRISRSRRLSLSTGLVMVRLSRCYERSMCYERSTCPEVFAGASGEEVTARPGRSEPPGVLQFDEQLIRIELPAIEQRPDVVVVDDEQVAGRPKGPPYSRVGAD